VRIETITALEKVIARMFEDKELKVPVHLSGGNEEALEGVFKYIREGDYVFSTHRNHYHYLMHGGDVDKFFKEIKGEPEGLCGGNSGSMHTIDVKRRFYSSAIVSGCCAIAVGVAWALRKKRAGRRRVWCFVGDGSAESGHFLEALLYAEGRDLPITFVIEDNDRSVATPIRARTNTNLRFLARLFEKRVMYYQYTPKYPHTGIGKFVHF